MVLSVTMGNFRCGGRAGRVLFWVCHSLNSDALCSSRMLKNILIPRSQWWTESYVASGLYPLQHFRFLIAVFWKLPALRCFIQGGSSLRPSRRRHTFYSVQSPNQKGKFTPRCGQEKVIFSFMLKIKACSLTPSSHWPRGFPRFISLVLRPDL